MASEAMATADESLIPLCVFGLQTDDREINFKMHAHEEIVKIAQPGVCYEPEVVNAIRRFVKSGDKAIDCGANLGFFTLLLAQLVGNTGTVLAFEPDPQVYRALIENVVLNNADNVIYSDYALWSEDGFLPFYIVPKIGYSSVISYTETEQKIMRARSLDSIIQPAWGHVRFIKIDCEGAEDYILQGAEKLLGRGVDCVIVEFNFHIMRLMQTTPNKIRERMDALGYSAFLIDDLDRPRLLPLDEELIEDRHLYNVMFSTQEKVEKAWNEDA
jgi:FkbM family methyltransferase